jgi:hypothetical protein
MVLPEGRDPRVPQERIKAMKRLICAALTLTMLGATGASAQPFHRGGYGYGGGWHRHDDTGALIGLGVGLFAQGRHCGGIRPRPLCRWV